MSNPRVLPMRKKRLPVIKEDPFKDQLDDAVLMAKNTLEKTEDSAKGARLAREEASQASNLALASELTSEQAGEHPSPAAAENAFLRAKNSAKQALKAQNMAVRAASKAEIARIYSNETNKSLEKLEQEYATIAPIAGFNGYVLRY
jgi:hypothetical protein